jgi:two-component system chemotaxis response regulator CheB
MGDDAAPSSLLPRRRGGRTIAQDEASCVVFGMPQELIRGGGASVVLPPQCIAAQLVAWLAPAAAGQTAKEAHGGAG